MTCTGMNPASRSTPGIRTVSVDRGTIMAVTNPVARVATAPVASRANIIGKVNVIASATLAYAGHDARMIEPATVAIVIQAASPATTPTIFLAISVPLGRSNTRVRG